MLPAQQQIAYKVKELAGEQIKYLDVKVSAYSNVIYFVECYF